MQVVIHAGAHITDEDRLVNCLVTNRETMEESGTAIPAPTSYRKLIRDLLQQAKSEGLPDNARDLVMDAVCRGSTPDRVVLSSEGFFGTPKMAVSTGLLYTATEDRLAVIKQIFAGDDVELCLAICNPATFLPAVFQRAPLDSFEGFMNGADPRAVRWSDMVVRVRAAFPDLPITIWCNEDLPLIFGQVIRELSGLNSASEIKDEYNLLKEIMSSAGMKRFTAYLETHPGMSETQKRRVIAAFLDKFAEDDAIEEELDIPGWTEALIDELTDQYDDDLYAIEAIPGIKLITP